MILGIGVDLTDIRRIEKVYERFEDHFIQRILTLAEKQNLAKPISPATLAKRFSAKEACAKALGVGMRQGVTFQTIEIGHHTSGQPFLHVHPTLLQKI